MTEKSEGIVLKSTPHGDRQKILQVFTRQEGLISLIVKNLASKRPQTMQLTTPFTLGEFVYRKKESGLHLFLEGSIKNLHLPLRENLETLQTAGSLVKNLSRALLPGRQVPALFALLETYLSRLPSFSDPLPLEISFYLKLLLHEGLFNPEHRPELFTEEEWDDACALAFARSFDHLRTLRPCPRDKIIALLP